MRVSVYCRCLLVSVLFVVCSVSAATVTLDEAGMDAIFAQASIDIRYAPTTSVTSNDAIVLDSALDFLALLNLSSPGTVQVFFVDDVDWCAGGNSPAFVGCSGIGGGISVVESSFAAGPFGTELVAHELAHQLGLLDQTVGGLMNETINNDTSLTAAEISALQASPRVQVDAMGQLFVEVEPVLVVPEPSSLAWLLGLLVFRRRSR